VTEPSTNSVDRCLKITKWGRCSQAATPLGLCSAHEQWSIRGKTPDPGYERKIVLGLIQPTWDYMSESEAHAVLNGRYRGDGRRIDQYVIDDPLGIDPDGI
jgi:hypothetical protein